MARADMAKILSSGRVLASPEKTVRNVNAWFQGRPLPRAQAA